MSLHVVKAGQSRKSKQRQERTHYSKEELRMVAIEEEGRLAYRDGVSFEDNPKVSVGARQAWWKGWNIELNDATGENP